MVNIQQFLPQYTPVELRRLDAELWLKLLERRKLSFEGFFETESKSQVGLYSARTVHIARGQDYLRGLFFRVIEEVGEALESSDYDHFLEELIDAVNYLLAAAIFDESLFTHAELAVILEKACMLETPTVKRQDVPKNGFPFTMMADPNRGLEVELLGEISYLCSTYIGDVLRIRSWTEVPQDLYFAGKTRFVVVLGLVFSRLFMLFPDSDTFYRFYVAKDDVLQFRLRSKY